MPNPVYAGLTDEEKRAKRAAYHKQYREKNRERLLEQHRKYNAEKREVLNEKSRKYYSENRKRFSEQAKKRYAENCEAVKKKTTAYAKENPEVHRRANRKYRKKHPDAHSRKEAKRRAIKANATIGDIEAIAAWEAQWRVRKTVACHWCGKRVKTTAVHVDHIIPLSRGGHHAVENLCVSCVTCNITKHAKLPEEWNANLSQPLLFV